MRTLLFSKYLLRKCQGSQPIHSKLFTKLHQADSSRWLDHAFDYYLSALYEVNYAISLNLSKEH